jgi:hypothetical protein
MSLCSSRESTHAPQTPEPATSLGPRSVSTRHRRLPAAAASLPAPHHRAVGTEAGPAMDPPRSPQQEGQGRGEVRFAQSVGLLQLALSSLVALQARGEVRFALSSLVALQQQRCLAWRWEVVWCLAVQPLRALSSLVALQHQRCVEWRQEVQWYLAVQPLRPPRHGQHRLMALAAVRGHCLAQLLLPPPQSPRHLLQPPP